MLIGGRAGPRIDRRAVPDQHQRGVGEIVIRHAKAVIQKDGPCKAGGVGGKAGSGALSMAFFLIAVSLKSLGQPPGMWYTVCVTANTITIRLRRPKAEIEAAAKPNINAWVNKLIEQALAPRRVDWNEHFEHKSKKRRFRYRSDEVRREQR